MRTKLKGGGQFRGHASQDLFASLAAEQCDLEKGFAVSEPLSLGRKHAAQIFFKSTCLNLPVKRTLLLIEFILVLFLESSTWADHLFSPLGFVRRGKVQVNNLDSV